MNFFFWILLNLGVPLLGPIFTLALVAPTHGLTFARNLIVESIKDGQLLWSTIALSAAATYEAVTELEKHGVSTWLELAAAFFCCLAFMASTIVMTETMKPHLRRTRRSATRTRAVTSISIFLTAVVAILFATLHYHTS
ncbi:hypothetical protein [Paraburkholderia sp.]|uniref:hypothetical protein n=1 Tax=Paraburkholderia sp. TaxID=1926495 RepID=UPI002383EE44|nr:hypothetical protein [Paraburkholderia sp.]MDE1181082.1 hypothetical protein [Paraburkholderia sp.]